MACVTKALADFACVGLQGVIKMPALDSAAGGEAPSPSAAAAATQNKWVVTIIYVPGEGDDAARALACDLSASVWFDNDRPRMRLNQAHCGINSSAAVLGVVTKSFGSNALVQLELKLALAQGKRVVLVRETDPPLHAPANDGVMELRRAGRPRRDLLCKVRSSLGMPTLAIPPALPAEQGLLVFTGDEAYALDSYMNLRGAFHSLGISSCFATDAD